MGITAREAARKAWRERFTNRAAKPRNLGKLEVRNAKSDTAEILLYDEIGPWGISANDFVTELNGITAPNIIVRINSQGGDVFDGLAIYSALQSSKATVTCVVDGVAASAASFIALAGDKVTMAENAFMMIHRAWGMVIGNEADLRDMAAALAKIDVQLAGIYAAKTGKPVADMAALMKGDVDGTWFTAAEARDAGLVDSVLKSGYTGKSADARKAKMRARLRLAEAEFDGGPKATPYELARARLRLAEAD